MNLTKIAFNRLIIHKIIGKTKTAPAYSKTSDELHKLETETEDTLRSRITSAVLRSKRFFETKVENTSADSFFDVSKDLYGSDKKTFIKLTKKIAQVAEDAHQRGTIPGGLLIIIEANIDSHESIIIIKAELQEALTLNGSAVELIKELFLSPAKEFYKIGILIHKNKRSKQPNAFDCYVYDDNFNPRKEDIAEYFYKDFLGFSTSENDKLRTNNFLKDFLTFVDENVSEFESRRNLKVRIKADYRESASNIIDPSSYREFFETDTNSAERFENQVLSKYPQSFSKDLSLVDHSLQKSSISITGDLRIIGTSTIVDQYVDIINPNSEKGYKKLTTEIEAGKVEKVVVINNSPNQGDDE